MWLRSIKPFWLREKIFWWFLYNRQLDASHFTNCPLEFNPNVRMDLTNTCISHRQIAMLGYIDRGLSQIVVETAKKRGGLLVDVGANWGYHTCLWAAQSSNCRAIAFEASPRNFPGLVNNIEKNKLSGRVQAHALAAGHQPGELTFDVGPEGETGWGGLQAAGGKGITVKVTTLDESLAAGKDEVEILKIDVEGADFWVIEGAAALLKQQRIRNIFFEANPARMEVLGVDQEKAPRLLRDCGYTTERNPGMWHAFLPSKK